MKKLLFYPPASEKKEYFILPESVEEIEKEVFSASTFSSFYSNDKLKVIREKAFYGNKIIKSVFLKATEVIENKAFALNDQLEYVVINSNKITINDNAFYGCKQLKTVVITSQEQIEIEENSFDGCESLKNIYVSNHYNGELPSISDQITTKKTTKCVTR